MTRFRKLLILTTAAAGFCAASAVAQNGPPRFTPLQLYACNMVDGSDMADLNAAYADLNEWMDEEGVDDYTLINLVPFYMNANFSWDVIILGAWPSGASMGEGLDRWVNDGGEMREQFSEVIDCPAHQGFATLVMNPPSGGDDGDFVTSFSNCTVAEGRTGPEAAEGISEWIEYEKENGLDVPHWIALPGPGEASDPGYSFKWISGYDSYASVGDSYEVRMNNGGLPEYNSIFSRLLSCDSPRIYNASMIREPAD